MIISPSIASSNVLCVKEEVDFVNQYFDDIHIDIEDGVVVGGISFGMKMAKGICSIAKKPVSLHLEVLRPLDYLYDLLEIRPNIIFIQIDHLENPIEVINAYKDAGLNVGLALTDKDLKLNRDSCLKLVDEILVLTAESEDKNQVYQQYLVDYGLTIAKKYNLKLWLDGGIDYEKFKMLQNTNTYAVVMGRAIFSNKEEAIRKFLDNE